MVTLLDFESVAAAAETALREKLALEVKARPQVPPAALFKPTVKKKKKPKPRGHRHEHRRLTSTSVREQLSIPSDAFVLTTIGTICRRKRQKWALYALRYLVQKKIDAYYLLVGAPSEKGGQGDPEYVVEFLNSVRKFDLQSRVRLVPFGVSVAPYLTAADLHTSPSSLEAYPLNTLEAMSLGVPVVATAAGDSWTRHDRLLAYTRVRRFLVARLSGAAPTAPARGTDGGHEQPVRSNELVDSRQAFLAACKARHWQFSDLPRARYSTMMLLALLGGRPVPPPQSAS